METTIPKLRTQACQEALTLTEQAKLATIVQKLTEKVLKLLNYLGGNCTNSCLGNQSWPKILGGKLIGLGGKFPPPKRCLDKTLSVGHNT